MQKRKETSPARGESPDAQDPKRLRFSHGEGPADQGEKKSPLLDMYDNVQVQVDVTKIRLPDNMVRSTEEVCEEVKQFRAMFRAGNYGATRVYICVGVLGEHVGEDRLREIRRAANEGRPVIVTDDLSISLIDGAHRLVALKDPKVLEVSRVVIADLYVRKDGKTLTGDDFLCIGSLHNKGASVSKKMSPFNRIETCLAVMRQTVTQADNNDGGGSGAVPSLSMQLRDNPSAGLLHKACVEKGIADMTAKQGRKYCTIAVGLFKHPGLVEPFREFMKKKRNLTVISCPRIWNASTEEEIKFLMIVVPTVMSTRAEPVPGKIVESEQSTSNLAAKISHFWEELEKKMTSHNVGMKEGLQLKVPAGNRASLGLLTVEERLLATFQNFNVENVLDGNFWISKQASILRFIETKTKWPDCAGESAEPVRAAVAVRRQPPRASKNMSPAVVSENPVPSKSSPKTGGNRAKAKAKRKGAASRRRTGKPWRKDDGKSTTSSASSSSSSSASSASSSACRRRRRRRRLWRQRRRRVMTTSTRQTKLTNNARVTMLRGVTRMSGAKTSMTPNRNPPGKGTR